MIKVTWFGQSAGNGYEFEVYPAGTHFAPFSGLYVFCRQANDGRWYVQYVGETSDFAERLNDVTRTHHAWQLAASYGATHIGVRRNYDWGGRDLRLQAETDLRRHLNPPANLQAAR